MMVQSKNFYVADRVLPAGDGSETAYRYRTDSSIFGEGEALGVAPQTVLFAGRVALADAMYDVRVAVAEPDARAGRLGHNNGFPYTGDMLDVVVAPSPPREHGRALGELVYTIAHRIDTSRDVA